MNKPLQAYALIQKKDGYENKAGEVVEISLWRRNLLMHYNPKYQKVVKIEFYVK